MIHFNKLYRYLWVCLFVLATGAARADDALPPSIAVLGVDCASKNKEWREGMVGFGIQNWVAQAFYDTGKFRLYEEKPEVLGGYQNTLNKTFDLAAASRSNDLTPIAKALGADIVAIGRVKNEYSRTSGMTFGPISSQTRDTYVIVELCLFDVLTGKCAKAEARGKVGISSSAVGADFGGKKLPFDPATVGPATGGAVEQAVAKLVPGYAPRNRSSEAFTLKEPLTFGVLPLALRADVAKLYPEIRTKRVAFGLHNRILKTVSGTQQCKLQEINPEVLEALELQWWLGSTGAPPAKEVSSHTEQVGKNLNWIIYGEVFSFAVSQKEKLTGLSGKVNTEVTLSVQLRAIDPSAQPARYYVASGTGKASGDWESWKGSDAEMEQSFVSKAASQAIESAWPALLRDLAAAQAAQKEKKTAEPTVVAVNAGQ